MKALKEWAGRIGKDIRQLKWAWILLLFYWCITRLIWGEFCPMRILTGLPCPGCGATRAGCLVLTLQLDRAFAMNPTIYLWIPYLLYLLWQRYLAGERGKRVCKKLNSALLILVCAVVMIWYVVGMTRFFPHREPFTYFEGNLLYQILLNSGNLF